MPEQKGKGRGWHGDSEGHARAGEKGGKQGSEGKGWHGDPEGHARAGREGGKK